MNRFILQIIIIFFSTNLCADSNERFKEFVEIYFDAVKNNNTELLKKLSVSKGMCQHNNVRKILNKVSDNPYKLKIAPFSKDNKDYKFALALSGGAPVILGEPSNTIEITWVYTKEEFTLGHKCHTLRMSTANVLLAVSDNKDILEHSYCQDNENTLNITPALLTTTQKNNVKEFILMQKQFSRIKTIQYLHKEFGITNDEANRLTTEICGEI